MKHLIARKFAKYLSTDELVDQLYSRGWGTMDISTYEDGEAYVYKAVGIKKPAKVNGLRADKIVIDEAKEVKCPPTT